MNTTDILGLALVGFGASVLSRDYQISGPAGLNGPAQLSDVVNRKHLLVQIPMIVAGGYLARDSGVTTIVAAALGGAVLSTVAAKQGWF